MFCFLSDNTDPFFNIASEEFLLKNYEEDIVLLYINEPCVIVGKHQNTLAEINYRYVTENQIKVIRRISGGGTVYHDNGNLNFTFITSGQQGNLVNFKRYTQPIVDSLNRAGINAQLENKNNLYVDGIKISGNAEHIYKNRVLHHGTLLFSVNLQALSEALRFTQGKYIDKAVKSISSNLANIGSLSGKIQDIVDLQKNLIDYIKNEAVDFQLITFKDYELCKIASLIKEKYSTWDWNFGYSPDYEFHNKVQIKNIHLEIKLFVAKGIIEDSEIKIDGQLNEKLSKLLRKTRHEKNEIVKILNQSNSGIEFSEEEINNLIWEFF
jgi:lipoate-protein ligase A